jgi:Rrf2 family protein
MFKVNRRTDYAIRLMVRLADGGNTIKASELGERTGVPVAFIHKIIQDLVRVGLVWTTAGPEGGATLARPAASITLLDIVESMEGPLQMNLCLLGPSSCDLADTCSVHPIWERVQLLVRQQLASSNLATLAREEQVLISAKTSPLPDHLNH